MTGRDWKGWVSYSRVVTSRDVDAGIGAWSACSSYRYIYIGHPYSLLPIHYHPLPCTTPPLLESPTYTLLGKVGYPPVGGGIQGYREYSSVGKSSDREATDSC